MKNILKNIAIVLILVGVFASCTNKEELSDNVPYKSCPCDEVKSQQEILAEGSITQGKAYLVNYSPWDKTFPPFEINENYPVFFIILDSKLDISVLFVCGDTGMPGPPLICRICNMPDFVNEWNIPENGHIIVNFTGIMYKTHEQEQNLQFYSQNESPSDSFVLSQNFILTSLKKR